MSTAIDTQALDALKRSVNALADRVERGVLNEGDVEQIVQDVMARSRFTRQGYTPGADWGDEPSAPTKIPTAGAERLHAIQALPADRAAVVTRRSEEEVRAFHQACDRVAILGALCQEGSLRSLPRDVRDTSYYQEEFLPLAQAMDTATAGEGAEFVPRDLSATLIDRINLDLRVASLFPRIVMPTNPFDLPAAGITRQLTATKAEETADTPAQKFLAVTPASRKVTLSAVKFGVRAIISKEAEEDSIVAMLPFLQDELVDFLSADVENAILNGDATAPHQDSDVTDYTDPKDPRTAWDGLRFLAPAAAKTDAANAVLTPAMLRTNRSKMSRYGIRSDQLAHIVPMRGYISLLSDANVQTLEKYGPNATILSGELGRVDGAPIVVSEYVRQDLNATGVFDNVTTNRTVALTVNRRAWMIGDRRSITVQVLRQLLAESDQDVVVVSLRKSFVPLYPTTEPIVGLTYNVA